ncbi:thymidylate synthase ThyX [Enterococcus gallinarum]|uniref:thymidylate synthase ThyX n=1 Tax=Enterococcus gallinarum TaxID=1353 RepID=UPI00288EAF2E|nr:thymidylate synthase ThyX [Enterococcus gallinarum]MDT2681391.1 thymidylate synthase ThyX [Enterococcus gallinarum]
MDIKIKKINFEGNILKVIKATVTEMRGINNHQKYDFDLYQIGARSPMSTREITLTVDFIEKKYQVILSLLVIGTIWI